MTEMMELTPCSHIQFIGRQTFGRRDGGRTRTSWWRHGGKEGERKGWREDQRDQGKVRGREREGRRKGGREESMRTGCSNAE